MSFGQGAHTGLLEVSCTFEPIAIMVGKVELHAVVARVSTAKDRYIHIAVHRRT